MCIHVGFYVMWYIWSCKWIFPLILESTYEKAVGSAIGVDSGPYDLVLIYRFLLKDLWIFLGWCVGYPTWEIQYDTWRISHLLEPAICLLLWRRFVRTGGAYLSPSYTSDKRFSKPCHLSDILAPWLWHSPPNEAIRCVIKWKKDLIHQGKKLTNLMGMSC